MTGETDDVRVKRLERRWVVRIVERGKLTQHFFDYKTDAENFAEFNRTRLGLPGMPPIRSRSASTKGEKT